MTSYLTNAEYRAAPTATDTNNLVVGGDQAAQDAALALAIMKASAWIDGDSVCGMPLIAASHIEYARVRYQPDGSLSIHPKRAPLNQLVGLSIGYTPTTLAAISDLSDVYPDEQQWVIPSAPVANSSPFSLGGGRPGARVLAKLTVVSGWPNTTLTAPTTAGATTIPVASVAGFSPAIGTDPYDQTITIYDGESTETVTVLSVSATSLTVSALVYGHATGVAISGLPADIKEGAVLATSAFLRSRVGESMNLSPAAQPAPALSPDPIASTLFGRARGMLSVYSKVR